MARASHGLALQLSLSAPPVEYPHRNWIFRVTFPSPPRPQNEAVQFDELELEGVEIAAAHRRAYEEDLKSQKRRLQPQFVIPRIIFRSGELLSNSATHFDLGPSCISRIGLSNVFIPGEGTHYKTTEPSNSCLRFRSRPLNFSNFKNPSSFRVPYTNRKARRALVSYGCYNSAVGFSREYGNDLCISGVKGSSTYNLGNAFKISRKLRPWCQVNDSLAYVNGNGRNVEFVGSDESSGLRPADGNDVDDSSKGEAEGKNDKEAPSLEELRDLLQTALKELEVARINSTMFEEKAQRISETAIALKDEADSASSDVSETLDAIQAIVTEEVVAKEAVQKATMALSLAEARLQVAVESLRVAKGETGTFEGSEEVELDNDAKEEEEALLVAQEDIRDCQTNLAKCEAQLRRLQDKKDELQKEVDRLNEVAEKAQLNALKAEEDVANIMLLAEQAVAFELEAAQHVSDAEIALQRAEKSISSTSVDPMEKGQMSDDKVPEEEKTSQESISSPEDVSDAGDISAGQPLLDHQSDKVSSTYEEQSQLDDRDDRESKNLDFDSSRDTELEAEKVKNVVQTKKSETQKELNRESSPFSSPKALVKKSSRFFSASFFSFAVDGTEFTAASVFQGLIDSLKKQWPKLVMGLLLLAAGASFYAYRAERNGQLLQQPQVITDSFEEISSNAKPLVRQLRKLPKRVKKLMAMLPQQEVNEEEASLFDMLWLLLASVIFVPVFQKIPGGSPVLGYLAAGILIGPYGLSIIRHVHGTKAIAEFGVVFLLFNIGLE
ncbi:hypothetical protein CRG98_034218, partial [Punica granatum]